MSKVKNGRWIRIKGNLATDHEVVYKCSECGAMAIWKREMESLYPSDTCNSCGADMVQRRTACLD